MKRIAFILLLASLAYSQGTFVGAGKGVGAGTILVVTGAAPALVQSWPASPATCAGVNTCTKTSAGNVTIGHLVIGWTSYNSTSATVSSVTICGNAGTQITNSPKVGGSNTSAVYYAVATSTATCPVVFNYSTTVTSLIAGADISNPNGTPVDCSTIQNQGAGIGTGTDAITSGNCTTTVNGDLIVGITFDSGFNNMTYTAGTGESLTGMPVLVDWWQGETKTQATAGAVASTFTCVTNCFGNPTTASVAVKHQ